MYFDLGRLKLLIKKEKLGISKFGVIIYSVKAQIRNTF